MNQHAYVDSIAATFETSVTEVVTELREPVAVKPQAALAIISLVVETIAGYALGTAAGELERSARAWFGADAAAAVRAGVPAPGGFRRLDTPTGFLADADRRPLVDELGARLRPRLRFVLADIERLVAYTAAVMPRGRDAETAAMFARLCELSLFDERLRTEIATGWTCACAAIEGVRLPDDCGSARSRALWQAWARLAGIEREAREFYLVAVR